MFYRNTLFVFTILLSLLSSNTFANELFIKLSAHELELPFASGENYILTAQIKGDAQNVRLTIDPRAEEGIALTRTDDDEYQLNLADNQIFDLLKSAEEKQFYILANNSDQEIFSSISVGYTIKKPNIYILTANSTRLLLSNQAYHTYDISSIEIEKSLEAVITIGKKNWLFKNNQPDSEKTTLTLPIDDEIRQQWETTGELSLMVNEYDQPIIIKAKPKLILDNLPQLFSLEQRRTKPIKGTNNNLKISIGDISRGYVNVTVYGYNSGNRHNLTESTTMSRYDKLSFNYAGQDYQLVLSELYNSITGSDYANFIFAPKVITETQKVNALLTHLQLTRKRLIVGDKQYYKKEIGEYLNNKFNLKDRPNITLKKLIKLINDIEEEHNFTHTFRSNDHETLIWWLTNAEKRLAL